MSRVQDLPPSYLFPSVLSPWLTGNHFIHQVGKSSTISCNFDKSCLEQSKSLRVQTFLIEFSCEGLESNPIISLRCPTPHIRPTHRGWLPEHHWFHDIHDTFQPRSTTALLQAPEPAPDASLFGTPSNSLAKDRDRPKFCVSLFDPSNAENLP